MRSRLMVLTCFALLGACASDTSNQGYTPCGDFPSGPVECQPGQYCVDATFSECAPGCTSDVNCADGQACVKPAGESVGDCVNEAGPPAGVVCGNGACEAGETNASCPADCMVAGPVCGNGACEAGETSASCAADCAPAGPVCGDGVCAAGESCPADCTDLSLAECLDHCDAYNFFECFEPGGLAACRDLCNAAPMTDREQFNVCAGGGAVSCDDSCFRFLDR